MHDLCIFLICFCSKIVSDQNFFSFCWDKLDYPGFIVYLSCSHGIQSVHRRWLKFLNCQRGYESIYPTRFSIKELISIKTSFVKLIITNKSNIDLNLKNCYMWRYFFELRIYQSSSSCFSSLLLANAFSK